MFRSVELRKRSSQNADIHNELWLLYTTRSERACVGDQRRDPTRDFEDIAAR